MGFDGGVVGFCPFDESVIPERISMIDFNDVNFISKRKRALIEKYFKTKPV